MFRQTCLYVALILLATLARTSVALEPHEALVITYDLAWNGVYGDTVVQGMNESGDIVATGFRGSGTSSLLHRTLVRDPIRCPHEWGTSAQSINKSGGVVGYCTVTVPVFEEVGFVRGAGNQYTLLRVPGAYFTFATDTNDLGHVVGGYGPAHTMFEGFFWDKKTFTRIAVPAAWSSDTVVNAINNKQQAVGFYFTPDGEHQGFLWDKGQFTPLTVPGSVATVPVDINDTGAIVGVWVDAVERHVRTFVYEAGHYFHFALPDPDIITTDITTITNGPASQRRIAGRYLTYDPLTEQYLSRGFVSRALPTPPIEPLPAMLHARATLRASQTPAGGNPLCDPLYGSAKIQALPGICAKR